MHGDGQHFGGEALGDGQARVVVAEAAVERLLVDQMLWEQIAENAANAIRAAHDPAKLAQNRPHLGRLPGDVLVHGWRRLSS